MLEGEEGQGWPVAQGADSKNSTEGEIRPKVMPSRPQCQEYFGSIQMIILIE